MSISNASKFLNDLFWGLRETKDDDRLSTTIDPNTEGVCGDGDLSLRIVVEEAKCLSIVRWPIQGIVESETSGAMLEVTEAR